LLILLPKNIVELKKIVKYLSQQKDIFVIQFFIFLHKINKIEIKFRQKDVFYKKKWKVRR